MSDQVTQSYSDCDGRTEESMHSVQSVWMARWTRTSYNATVETHNRGPNAPGNKESHHDSKPLQSIVELETLSKLSKSAKRLSEPETQLFEVVNESRRTNSRTIAKETLGNRSPSCSLSENVKTTFQDPLDCVKTHSYISGRSIVASRPLLDSPSRIASHLVPYQEPVQYVTREGESVMKPFISRSSVAGKDEVLRLRMLEPEHDNYHKHSPSLVCEERLDNHPEPGKSITPYLRQNNTFLLDVPSTSTKHLPEFGGEEFKKVPGCSFIRLFQNEPSPSQISESKELHSRSYDPRKLPHPLLDVERMRKSITMDSVTGLAGYYPHISQTTHGLLITKGADANLCEENKVIGKRTWGEFNGKASLSDHDVPSKSLGHHKGGMKLHLLDCFTGSEGKENIEDRKRSKVVLKNESSAETDTMDLDMFQEKSQLSGISSSTAKKMNEIDKNSPSQLAVDCSRKASGCKRFDIDINLELPAPTDNVEPTSSRTESLDLESILAPAERPSSRTDLCPEGLLGQDASSSWVKRLKAGASGSLVFGSKSSSFIGESSHERTQKFLSKVTKATMTSSQPTSTKLHGKELMSHDKSPGLTMNSSPSSTSVIKKDVELVTSLSWIQRLLHARASPAHKRPQPVVVCQPHSSKLEPDDYQKKQLPSLGAMALMGKTMNGFQPFEFHRRGPLVVWNTRSF